MQETVESLNAALAEKYRVALSSWGEYARTRQLSQPQLMAIPKSYLESSIRLMIVGQESAGWGDPAWDASSDEGRTGLLKAYTDFDLALPTRWRGTPFWKAAYFVRERINPEAAPNSFLWSNLVPVSEKQAGDKFGRPSEEVARTATSMRLLQAEIEVAKPEAIVFFTGVSRDPLLRALYREMDLVDRGDGIAEVEGLPNNAVGFRTEHPKTLRMRHHESVLQRLTDLIRESTKASEEMGDG